MKSISVWMKQKREYGKMVTKAKDMRGTADYGMYKEFSIEEVESLIEDAERFLERITRAIKEGER